MFKCIDQNHNGHVNKEEILLFLKADRDGERIFPPNYMKAVENFETRDTYLIDFGQLYADEFIRLVKEVPYLSFPAFRLQKSLRAFTLGERKWKKIAKRLEKRMKREAQIKETQFERTKTIKQKQWEILDFSKDSARSYNVKPQGLKQKRLTKRTASYMK